MIKKFNICDLRVGDKITMRNNYYRFISNVQDLKSMLNDYNDDLISNLNSEFDIVKVERFIECGSNIYKNNIIFSRKKDILDKTEKDYLSHFINPYRNKIVYIRKREFNTKKEYLHFELTCALDCFSLPNFKKNSMYKNMELNKKYKIEELGL